MSKSASFMQRFGRQHVKRSKALLRSARNQFKTNLQLIRDRRSRKRLVLLGYKFLGQFVNPLTADYMYSRYNRENLWQEVSMQIPRKLKTFSRFLIALLKSTLNLEYFERKHQCQRLNITEISNYETDSYLNIQKAIFHATLLETTC